MSELPQGWVKRHLSDAISPRGEKVSPSAFPHYTFLGMDHVESQTTRIIGGVPASEMKSNASRFYAGDVLYGRLRPYLNKVAQPNFDGLASAEFIVFPNNQLLQTDFLKYRLNALDFVRFSSHLNEGDRPRVSFDQIGNFQLLIPPIKEQSRIVAKIEELFSELDKGIESLRTAREQLKIYRQAVLKHAFEGKLTAQWREENKDKLETADELLARFEFSAAENSLPKNWITVKFKSLYEVSQNGLSKRSGKAGKNIPVLRLADITNYKVDQNDLRSILLDEREAAKYDLTNNDLLAIRVNGSSNLVGRMILAQNCNGMAYCDHFIRFRFNPSVIIPKYVQYYFNTHKARRYIDLNKVSSAGQNTVSQATLGELDVPYCSLEEQRLLVDFLSEKFVRIDSIIEEIDQQLEKAEALRQSILKRAFSGKLVAQDPNDEPASVLLEHIKAENGIEAQERKKKRA